MSFLLKTIKVIIYSNLLVSCSVAAFTHLTYYILNFPKDNALEICAMVFCFTFTTYNGQRIFRLSKYHDLGERLQWVVSNKTILSVFFYFDWFTWISSYTSTSTTNICAFTAYRFSFILLCSSCPSAKKRTTRLIVC